MWKLSLWMILGSALAAVATAAEPQERMSLRGSYDLLRTHDFHFTSREGQSYRLLVAEPEAKAPPQGFPVLYVLDANSCFGTVVEAQRLQARRSEKTGVDPMLVVGVGYPGDKPFDTIRRTFDLTPPADTAKLPPRRDGSDWPPSGGADAFLEFLESEVKPQIESRFKVDRQQQAIFGHSFGGLFVLHMLFTRPEAFQCYVAASPSVWWNDYALLDDERVFRERIAAADVPVRLLVVTGELEEGSGPGAALPPTTSSSAFGTLADMTTRLVTVADRGASVEFQEVPGENHGSVVPVALNRALRFASIPSRRTTVPRD